MTRPAKEEEREERINMEIIVDAYGPEEQAMGWYTYLSDTLQFPFSAKCVARRTISPLEPGDEAEVVGMDASELKSKSQREIDSLRKGDKLTMRKNV